MEQEAWLSGKLEEITPILMPAAHALKQAAKDIQQAAKNLTAEEIRLKPHDSPSVAFHLKHIAGSIDRLLTYARGEQLNEKQFEELAAETKFAENINVKILIESTVQKIEFAIDFMRRIEIEKLFEERVVGRQKLPTNVFGLLFHIAEHTQRHTGQIIMTAKVVRHLSHKT